MANKDIEIPFGAYDSELGGFEYTIPEGYKAEIKDGKVVVKKTESEDEKMMRKFLALIEWSKSYAASGITSDEAKEMTAWLEKQGEQKPAWSEEDEARFESCIKVLQTSDGYDTINAKWFKSLKDRVQPLPKQGWSEEDKVKINRIVACLENLNVVDNDILLKDVAWLKSLKGRCTWKPSDEQMLALADAIETYCGKYKATLTSFYNVLKKLTK